MEDKNTEGSEEYLAELERQRAAKRRRDTTEAYIFLVFMGILIIACIVFFTAKAVKSDKSRSASDTQSKASSESVSDKENKISDKSDSKTEKSDSNSESTEDSQAVTHDVEVIDGITYIDEIMIVNKTYSLPADYAPGFDPTAYEAFNDMVADAAEDGISLFICSGYRSYSEQETLYNNYVAERGTEAADKVSSRPGHSEHQTGLCIDVNTTEFSFEGTPEAVWIEEHCAEYGYIVRFPKGKEDITGYSYEPWHIRYVGVEAATEIMEQGICLEEYLGVTSQYAD